MDVNHRSYGKFRLKDKPCLFVASMNVARRKYWIEQMEAAHEFMQAIAVYPVPPSVASR